MAFKNLKQHPSHNSLYFAPLFHWPQSTSWRIMADVVQLPNNDHSQQVERLCRSLFYYPLLTTINKLNDYVGGCSTTNYWPKPTSWRIMSEVVLLPNIDRSQQDWRIIAEVVLLPNTDRRQQVEDYLRGCTTSTKYWPQSTSWRIISEVVLLPNTDHSQQVEGLCQRLYYYQILNAVNKLNDYVRGCTTTNYWPHSTNWRIMSEVILLPNTDRSQQVEGLCQRL